MKLGLVFPHFRLDQPDSVPDGDQARRAFTCTPLLSCSLQVTIMTAPCQGRGGGGGSALTPGVFN